MQCPVLLDQITAPPPPPTKVNIYLTFDDGPTSVASHDHTRTILDTLLNKSVSSATFYVQTHVWNRGGDEHGRENMELAFARGHSVEIHTGSDEDHAEHPDRVALPPYDANGDNKVDSSDGQTALDSDLIRAKARIGSLSGGKTPTEVRPPKAKYNSAVSSSYSRNSLVMKLWDIDSKDTQGSTVDQIKSHLKSTTKTKVQQNNTTLVYLFHDIKSATASNLSGYMQAIKEGVESAGNYEAEFK